MMPSRSADWVTEGTTWMDGPAPTDAEIAAVLAGAVADLRAGVPCSVMRRRAEQAAASRDAEGWCVVGWVRDEENGQTVDVLWHAGRGERRLRPWAAAPAGRRPPRRQRPG
jgi:hypothetical protein